MTPMSVRTSKTFQLVSAAVVVLAWSLPRSDERKQSAQELQRLADLEAARNAHYYFSSDVQDQINDLTQHRDELRDGLKVRGSFSYSDGFLRRHVSYEADENGYRIIRYALMNRESDLTLSLLISYIYIYIWSSL
jgi:hypothetical protein